MRNSNFMRDSIILKIQDIAAKNGLTFIGIASLDVTTDSNHYRQWIDEGRHAEMTWMEKNVDVRANPSLLIDGAKSGLIFGYDYYLGDRWSRATMDASPKIAQYARLPDYHKFMRKKLTKIVSTMDSIIGPGHLFRITVDSAPLLERALAAKTGNIFIGKNTCAIHPKRGSFFLLGEIITSWFDAQLANSEPAEHQLRSERGGCGTCRRCQVHCPTGALDEAYRIDARKCLSYWTIEHRGEIPFEYWEWVARYMFGCDICQLVCPYNRGLTVSAESKSMTKIHNVDLLEIATMDQSLYEQMFGGTPMTRAKRTGLRRNAIIAATVRKDLRVIKILEDLVTDSDPIVSMTARAARVFLEKDEN